MAAGRPLAPPLTRGRHTGGKGESNGKAILRITSVSVSCNFFLCFEIKSRLDSDVMLGNASFRCIGFGDLRPPQKSRHTQILISSFRTVFSLPTDANAISTSNSTHREKN